MINSVMTIGGHLTDRKLCDSKGASITLPPFYPSLYQFRLKLFDKGPTGDKAVQVFPHVDTLVSSMGLVYAQPRAGTFKLRYATGTATAAIDFNEEPDDFKEKLQAITVTPHNYGLDVVYSPAPSTWVMRFTAPPVSPPLLNDLINEIENELEPETFVRVRQYTQNAETWVEVRLLQGPIASTNDHDTFLPPGPSVETIRDGETRDEGLEVIKINEIQSIYVPPDFAGTYVVKFGGRESAALSATDGPQTIQDALNQMYEDGITRFTVTNPEANKAYVQFVGPFSGENMDPLVTAVVSAGKPDLFFQINLFTTEVAEALQRLPEVQCFFEVRIRIIADPPSEEDPGQDIVLFQESITIKRPLHWEGLEEAAPINWLYPPNPKDYIPYTQDQAGFGAVNYSIPFGNGTLNDYSIAHDLNSSNLQVSVRQNALDGRQLNDEEFSVTFDDNNALTIHIEGAAPATNSLIAVILSSGIENVFSPHTHTIGQIVGLQEAIDGILARLAALEALLPEIIGLIPGASPFGTDPGSELAGFDIPNKWDLIPTNRPPIEKSFDPKKIAPAGYLLPAVHDVIELGLFTVTTATNLVTLTVDHPGLVAGQRVRIYIPEFYEKGPCTFDADEGVDLITTPTPHGLANGRRVKFAGGELPEGISQYVAYYVINQTSTTFQISTTLGGEILPLFTDGVGTHTFLTISEVPGGLEAGVDYFILAPTAGPTTFKLSKTIGGTEIDIGPTAGYTPYSMSSVEEMAVGPLPDPGPTNKGQAYSVREDIYLPASVGIPSETVHAGDLIASDGRIWYHVTRSDSVGSNSFYPNPMEKEIFRVALNENMLKAGSVFTMKFDLGLQMFKHDCNVQYLLVIEYADLPQTLAPLPTGPNLFEVDWNPVPIVQQRMIVTDILVTHKFGVQVINDSKGRIRTNKKLYGVELAGDIIPPSTNIALRCRLIEFDTEDNVADAMGLIYYTLEQVDAGITRSSPTAPVVPVVP